MSSFCTTKQWSEVGTHLEHQLGELSSLTRNLHQIQHLMRFGPVMLTTITLQEDFKNGGYRTAKCKRPWWNQVKRWYGIRLKQPNKTALCLIYTTVWVGASDMVAGVFVSITFHMAKICHPRGSIRHYCCQTCTSQSSQQICLDGPVTSREYAVK